MDATWFLTNSGFIFQGFPLQNTGFTQLNGVMVSFVCQLCQAGVPSCLMKCLCGCGHVLKQDLTFTNTDLKHSRLPFIEQESLVQSSKNPKSKTEIFFRRNSVSRLQHRCLTCLSSSLLLLHGFQSWDDTIKAYLNVWFYSVQVYLWALTQFFRRELSLPIWQHPVDSGFCLFVSFSSQRTLASADAQETFINICKVNEFVNNGYRISTWHLIIWFIQTSHLGLSSSLGFAAA